MKSFRLWTVVLHPSYEEKIIMHLVKKGYKVSPLASSGTPTKYNEGYLSAVVALRVETEKELDFSGFRDLMQNDFDQIGVKYHAIIVESGGAGWTGSNIKLSAPEQIDTGNPYRTVH